MSVSQGDLGFEIDFVLFRDLIANSCVHLFASFEGDRLSVLISIPPNYSVSQVIGYIKGKSAINIARIYQGQRRRFVGSSFWARGYDVSTVGPDEALVRQCIRDQEKEDEQVD